MLATLKQTAELVELFRLRGTKQTFRKGDFIIRPGDPPHGVFYIHQGLVKAYDITKYNEENLLIIRKADELFPLIWAITGQERHVIYQALAPTITWQLSRSAFLEFVENKPETMAPLLDMTIEMYRLHSERILNLEYRTVRERIISFLLTMSGRFGKPTEDGLLIEVPLRHQDIASSVNATRETTSRELSALERKGLLRNKQSLILLKDLDGLRKHLN
ncbi:MAG TPA: Crp/Fnr family transcriptional regulator [Verrucomicrobiae bacterium]|jgi:CRP-like cAMP-binding protein|nr:Crp/Fnr family transcriptional regulator [Verrucomicrobiae bacterium]